MDNVARLDVYKAQCINVRALDTARRLIMRAINDALRVGMIERVENIPLERANWTVATKKVRLKPKGNAAE